ncbi:Pre-rRNA-processing protein TSR2-domain-containing protein [Xylariaceae sp. FL1651]|nr:Pre-rRNA-processing protein TSR2-domain-containing protein [Xylariaceae sp. FL1651]
MASSFTEGPSPELRQEQFEQSVAISLHLWPSLTIAVQNNWGGADSADKRDWLAGAIVEMFPSFVDLAAAAAASSTTTTTTTSSTANPSQNAPQSTQSKTKPQNKPKLPDEPIAEDIEETLLQVMFDEFEANVDDQSESQVADRIMKCRAQCAAGDFTLVEELRRRWLDTKGKKVIAQAAADQDQDTDRESGSDDEDDGDEEENGDIDMHDAPALVSAVPRDKPTKPQPDADGWTTVPGKRR